MRWYLLRHAQSENNETNLSEFDSRHNEEKARKSDPKITNLGILQSKEAARWIAKNIQNNKNIIAEFKIKQIYCSPMLRSVQTAQIIHSICKIPVEIKRFLHEQGGIFEGLRCLESREPEQGEIEEKNRSKDNLVKKEFAEENEYKGASMEVLRREIPNAVFPQDFLVREKTEKKNGWWIGKREAWIESIQRAKEVANWMWYPELNKNKFKEDVVPAALIVGHGLFHDLLIKTLLDIKIPRGKFKQKQVLNMPNYFLSGNCSLSVIHLAIDDSRCNRKPSGIVLNNITNTEECVRSCDNSMCNIKRNKAYENHISKNNNDNEEEMNERVVAVIAWNQRIVNKNVFTGQAMGKTPRVYI